MTKNTNANTNTTSTIERAVPATRTPLAALAVVVLALGGCAFDVGPARHLSVELLSRPSEPVVNDLGWEVTVDAARVFLHHVRFHSGASSSAAETGETHSHLTAALETAEVETGVLRLAHSTASAAPAGGSKVGELIVDRAIDLLAVPAELGEAIFACGAEATEARILVAPPEGDVPGMHGGGLYLAGTAVPPGGGDAVAFEAVLPVGTEAAVSGLDIDADDEPSLEIHVPRDAWFDGIDFAALPGGAIEDGSEEAEGIEHLLLNGGLHVHVGEE